MARFKKRWWSNTISCDEGFSVEIQSFLGALVYQEGVRIAYVSCDPAVPTGKRKKLGWIFDMSSITGWDGPNGREPFQPGDKDRIADNVARAMDFAGYSTYVGRT